MSIGFKEWQIVCDALGHGGQSIILRKGGIAEGRDGFQFAHPEFYLFPTLFHEQAGKVRPEFREGFAPPPEGADAERAEIPLEYFARIDFHRVIEDWDRVAALEPFHIWSEEEIRKRFDWDEAPGISLACVRVYRLAAPWPLENRKSFGGCRSWITLPEPERKFAMEPVLDDAAFGEMRERLVEVLGG